MLSRLVSLGLLLMLFGACKPKSNLERTFALAGSNRKELEEVLKHYSVLEADTLKLKAAYFLIGNMHTQFSYQSNFYHDYQISMRDSNITNSELAIDSLNTIYKEFNKKVYDCQVIRADYLIENIELAFKVWEEQPWGQYIDFKTFCDYILPYKVGNEPIENWRSKAYKQYNHKLDSVRRINGSVKEAAIVINDQIAKKKFDYRPKLQEVADLGFNIISSHFIGHCKTVCDYTIYCMRAVGIPAGEDFVKQWANNSGAHVWNFVIDESGKVLPFDGYYGNVNKPDYGHPHNKKGKVFRRTYSLAPIDRSLASADISADFFSNPNIKDVSEYYWKSAPVKITPAKDDQKSIAFLCVFNNSDWVPVQWARRENNSYTFTGMEPDVVYLPCYAEAGEMVPFHYPIIPRTDSQLSVLKPLKGKQQRVMYRKYPYIIFLQWDPRIIGGTFQGANKPDFTDAQELATINALQPTFLYSAINIQLNKKFRYVRYRSPDNGFGNMAELKFYSRRGVLDGKIIGVKIDGQNYKTPPENAFDDDNLTYYMGPVNASWVGLDLGKRYQISKIEYALRNDDNYIKSGDSYELFYQSDRRWISLGMKVADTVYLKYDNVPENGLLWLRNYTRGREERIFTYEKGEVAWW